MQMIFAHEEKRKMSEYKPPIKVTIDDISNKVINLYDNEIIYKVKKITEIDVDKERLINALLLDKNLVRCKDCKYFKFGNGCILQSIDYEWEEQMYANDFCSKGERE